MIGIIYCIYNTVDDKVYVGSTAQTLNGRWKCYRNSHNNPKQTAYNQLISEHMRKLGFDKFYIELIEQVIVDESIDIVWYESLWEQTLRDAGYQLLNQANIRGHTKAEENAEYYMKNAETIKAKVKRWKRDNSEYSKQWYKEYFQNNKDKINKRNRERVNCPDCGKELARGGLSRHRKKTCPQNKNQ